MIARTACAMDGAQVWMWLCLGGMLGAVAYMWLSRFEDKSPPEDKPPPE